MAKEAKHRKKNDPKTPTLRSEREGRTLKT